MLRTRASIAGLMWVVLVVALGLAGLKSGTDLWSASIFLLTCAAMALGIVGIVCDAPAARRWWVGFTVFGVGYLILEFWFPPRRFELMPLATDRLLEWLGDIFLHRQRNLAPAGGSYYVEGWVPFSRIGHCLVALVIATAAGTLARAIFPAPAVAVDRPSGSQPEPEPARTRRWLYGAVGGLAMILYAAAALMGARTAPGLWAGVTVLVTWTVLGLVALGTVFSRGRRRARRLGAVLFGAGYLALVSGHLGEETWPQVATNQLLDAVRSRLPTVPVERIVASEGVARANDYVLEALDKTVTFDFSQETPLEDVLRYIVAATHGPGGRELQIYVDPVGLQEAEKTTSSPVTLVMHGVPLRTTLKLLLDRIGLTYGIKGGVLLITSESTYEEFDRAYDDPFLLTGQCLLALVAAGVGGLLAPLVHDSRREHAG